MSGYPWELVDVWIVHVAGPMDVEAVFDSEWAAQSYASKVNQRGGHEDGDANSRIVYRWRLHSDPEWADR